jgi:hypothetical protein
MGNYLDYEDRVTKKKKTVSEIKIIESKIGELNK